jgi:hypothetical protein
MAIEPVRKGEDEQAVRGRLGQVIEALNGLTGSSGASNIQVAAIEGAGGTLSIEAGTLQDVLQALADAIDPAA